jgi:hypothetical protein
MALPSSGTISVDDIYTEINGLSIAAAGDSNVSFSNLAYAAGFTPPQAISDFYGYSSYYATYAGDLGGTIYFSNEGSQNHTITCANKADAASTWDVNSVYTYGGTLTSVSIATVQDADGFVVNDDGQNRLYISRSISAFNAATIEVWMYPPSSGNTGVFSGVSFSTYNGTVTTFTWNTQSIHIIMSTSAGSLTSHSLTVYFDL